MKFVRTQWDRVGAVAAVVVGVLLLLLGWAGVRGTAYPAEQIPYVISGGLGGMLLVSVGAVLWISADLRDEWRKIDSLERAVRGEVDDVSSPPRAASDRGDDRDLEPAVSHVSEAPISVNGKGPRSKAGPRVTRTARGER